ncbi:Heavy metal-associated isoprenylated plant protein [Quillaja saponaria]|uniref:Heavy metal-associated isoprenylated plant protein n=1 Tax=Quillaja saponaria TaxID=32244 RepID=A0AAD7Q8S3_QUISA|nr:Heavy metal-associated isoprenylated plant protein [Quillaja saponaria]
MGEKQDVKNETEKKPDAGAKKDDSPPTVVLKIDIHCEGCAKKIRRAVRHLEGVEDVKTDMSANKLTVIGRVDPTKIQEKLAGKTKKKVDLVSPQPKKDAGGDKKPDEKSEKKSDEKKAEDKKPEESTVAMKIRLHCDGCISKIRKIIQKIKGVESVNLDGAKDLVTVKGTMDGKELVEYLKEKLKRSVEVVPPKKAEDKKDKDGEKKENKEGGGEKKKEADGKPAAAVGDGGKKEEGGGAKVEVNKLEHYGYAPPTYYYDGHVADQASTSYAMEYHPGYANQGYVNQGYVNPGYVNQGYPVEHPFYMRPQPPQIFSDENPNACSVM